jgi:ATP-dependent Clp protease ATP-binding subunit ClpA
MSDSHFSDDVFLPTGQLRPEVFSNPSHHVLAEALAHAQRTRWETIRTPHLFMGLLSVSDRGVREWCRDLGADLRALLGQFETFFRTDRPIPHPCPRLNREFISDNAIRVLRDAQARCTYSGRRQIAPLDLLVSLLVVPTSIVTECFERIGYAPGRLVELAILAGERYQAP